MMNLSSLHRVLPLLICCVAGGSLFADPAPGTYQIVTTLPVGGAGRWDYITVDATAKLLYVPRSTHVMVLSEETGKTAADVPNLGGVHGVALAPALHRGFISDGEDGSVVVFDTKSHAVLGKVKAAADADGIIYDAGSKRVLVGCGDAGVVIAIDEAVDPDNGKMAGTLELGGKPEFLATDGAGHAFVNIVDKNEVVEFDPKEMKQLARWPVAPGTKPTSMAIDAAHHLLFVGCRNQKLVILDTETGKVVATFPVGKGVDATVFDDGKILTSAGDGTLSVIAEESSTVFKPLQTLKTAVGARTLGVDPETHRLYLPTADMKPADPSMPAARPQPVEGSFKIVVAGPTK